MKTKNKFYLLLATMILISTACNNEETKNTEPNISIPENKNALIVDNMINNVIHEVNITPTKKELKKKELNSIPSTFTFENFKDKKSILTVKNDVYTFTNIEQDIIMINLSSTWCPPCRGEIPHLNSLQKKFKNHLFILTALVHDNIKDNELKKLIVSEKAQFFVSTNQKENEKFEKMIMQKLGIVDDIKLPLMVLFYKGKYFTHYEGSMPEEMIESDIKQLLEKRKERKNQ